MELLEVGQAGVEGEVGLEGVEVVAGQPGADRQGGPLAAGHRVDRRLGGRHGVAAGKDAGGLGASGELVGLEGAPGREAELLVGVAHVGGVVGGGDHRGGGHDEGRAPLGPQLAVGPGREGDALDPGRLAGAIGLDLPGLGREDELDAFVDGGHEVAGAGRQRVGRVAGDDRHAAGPETHGRTGGVEGRHAVADHGDRLAQARLFAFAQGAQELETVERGLGARQTGAVAAPGADAHEDGVHAGFEQALEGDLAAQADAVDEPYAGLPERFELALEHRLGQAERRDAVAQHAAGLVVAVVDGHGVAGAGEIPGGRQAGRARRRSPRRACRCRRRG